MKSLRIVLVAAFAAALAVGALGCSDKNTAAKVNGDTISIEELDQQVAQLKKQYPDMFTGADGEGRLLDFKQRLLDNLVNQKLVDQAAAEKKITVTDAEVDKQVEQLKAGFKDDAQFQAALKSAGMDVATLAEQIKEQLLTQKLIEELSKGIKITEADMKSYYGKNKTQFAQKAAKRSEHILFKPEDKKTAQKVLDLIKGGSDFNAMAKQNSVDTATASKGGDLGWPTTANVPEFEAAVAKLRKGEMSGLVQSPYGWHIIRVADTRAASQQSFSAVKSQIEQILIQQQRAEAYQKFLDELRSNAKIEILLEELKASSKPSVPATTTK
jgi:foldase protein PrsA